MIPNAWQGFDFGLGEDVDQLRDTARSFSQDRIAPRADEIDRTNQFPRDLWPALGELGVHGLGVADARLDLAGALLHRGGDRLDGELVEDDQDDQEADHLHDDVLRLEAEAPHMPDAGCGHVSDLLRVGVDAHMGFRQEEDAARRDQYAHG